MYVFLKPEMIDNFIGIFCHWYRTAPSKPTVPVSPATKSSLYRGTASRNTFHGGPIRDRRQPKQYNGPDGIPSQSQDTSAMGQAGRLSFFNKLTSKFSRR